MRRLARRAPKVRRVAFALAAALAAAMGPSCRSPVPDEHVYTGRDTSGRGASTASGGSNPVARGGSGPSPDANGGRGGALPSSPPGGSAPYPDEPGGAGAGGEGTGARGGAPPIIEEPPPLFSKEALLGAIATCTFRQIEEFAMRADALAELAEAHADAPSEQSLAVVRSGWQEAMRSFQVLEALRFGPFARTGEDPKGRDLRDQIYAWPLGGRCNLETQLVSQGYESATFGTSLINLRGLGALEYLLFYSGNDNACPSYSAINKDGTWTALDADELARRKARYATVVAADVARHARELRAAWESGGGNFQAAFVSGAAYPSAQAALNAASNALFYIEVEVKDLKLGVPLGLSPDCTSATCPEALESRYASYSKRNIVLNLRGFRRLFTGCSATSPTSLGFDDWLMSVGAGDLAQRMLAELEGAERSVAEVDATLEQQLASDPASVRRIYDEVKALTDVLKSEFVSVLELELPQSTEGDND